MRQRQEKGLKTGGSEKILRERRREKSAQARVQLLR